MMYRFQAHVAVICWLFVALVAETGDLLAQSGDRVRFQDVAQIFAAQCVRCHNDVDQEGDFSLQSAASLSASDHVQPGDTSSQLLRVIQASGDEPPSMPKDARPLPHHDVALIQQWIEQGARWPEGVSIETSAADFDWWSFKPITRPVVPAIDSDWIRNPIDAFIAAKHQHHGLKHSSDADRRTLIRRVTFDLIGMPPTPSQVEQFVNDPDPMAYETLVDRLLESSHYGEHWARHWLDVVKYADTCGYDKDKLRPNAWPYRDYVIRSFNEDKPYWRFVQEQIAGDVLFPGSPDGILALGFIAAGPWDHIGHVEVPESKIDGMVARNLDRDEMVTNTFNTFCSLTVQCARCHDHKFDPFTQDHYYSLQAVFAAVDRAERPYDLDPETESRRSELENEIAQLQSELGKLNDTIAKEGGAELSNLGKEIEQLKPKVGVQKDPAFGYHSGFADSDQVSKWVEVDLGRNVDISEIVLRPCHDDFGGIGSGFGFPVRFRIDTRGDGESELQPLWSSSDDVDNPLLSPFKVDGRDRVARHLRVTATKLAKRSDTYIFALAELQVLASGGDNVARGATVTSLDSIENPVRWAKSNLVDGSWAQPRDKDAYQRLVEAKAEWTRIYERINTPERIAKRSELQASKKHLQSELSQLPAGKMVYAAATKFKSRGNFKATGGVPRSIHVLGRGDVTSPGAVAVPGTLPLSTSDPWKMSPNDSESARRAALAHWLTRENHPLLWRSIVNRIWQYHFGRALVASPNDFGRMGSLPTHPQLLDWLAAEFRDGGQSMKQLHRLIVTSSTYRQSSEFDETNAAIDASNQFMWRMDRRRLTAEEIRDSILAVSGALDTTMGGPGFYLFQLEKTEHSPHYEYHKFDPSDPISHRRSVYRFIVRSQPDPYMTTLDCADSSQSTPKRLETLTSLQALALLNNRFNLVMAGKFADRLRGEAHDLTSQVDRAFTLVTSRSASKSELASLVDFADQHGLENMCRLLLNLNEFVFID